MLVILLSYLLLLLVLGPGTVPAGRADQEDQSWTSGKHVQAEEAGRLHGPLQEDHHQSCAQKETFLSYMVIGICGNHKYRRMVLLTRSV